MIRTCFFIGCLLAIFSTSLAQNDSPLSNVVELLPDKRLKFYAKGSQLAEKPCAEYYRIAPFDTTRFVYQGKVTDYYMDGKKALEANYLMGLKFGTFKAYYPNGTVREEGRYRFQQSNQGYINYRDSIWTTRYENGILQKQVVYLNGDLRILMMNDEAGKPLIRDGNGLFKASVRQSKIGVFYTIQGEVEEGLRQGEWTAVFRQDTLIREYYSAGKFIRGLSYSKMLGTEQLNAPGFTIIDVLPQEHLKVSGFPPCLKTKTKPSVIYFELSATLKATFKKLCKAKKIKNAWILISYDIDRKTQKIKDFKFISHTSGITREALIKFFKKNQIWNPKGSADGKGFEKFALANGEFVRDGW